MARLLAATSTTPRPNSISKVPQTVTLSLFQQLDRQWALLASVNWQDWSEFGDIGVQVDTSAIGAQSTTVDAGFKDTWHLSLGAQYQATEQWLWNVGVAYDSSAVSDSKRSRDRADERILAHCDRRHLCSEQGHRCQRQLGHGLDRATCRLTRASPCPAIEFPVNSTIPGFKP